MDKTYKIRDTIQWFKQFNQTDILIKTESKQFDIALNTKALPHLLGMQYIFPSAHKINITGFKILKYIQNKSDWEIYQLVQENNPQQLNSVKARVDNIKYFFEHLEEARLYEQTATQSKIKSIFLLVKVNENEYLQLGLVPHSLENTADVYLETFLVRKDNYYIRNSKISEKIISIEKYNDKLELVPFSFKQETKELKQQKPKTKQQGLTL